MICNFQCISERCNDFQRVVIDVIETTSENMSKAVSVIRTGVTKTFSHVAHVAENTDAVRQVIIGAISSFYLSKALGFGGTTHRALTNMTSCAQLLEATRVALSFDYFFNGKFVEDLHAGKVYGVVADAFFAVGRVGVAVSWLAKQGMIKLDRITKAIASTPVFGVVAQVGLSRFVEVAFLLGLGAHVIEKSRLLMNGEDVAYNIVDLINAVSEVALLTLALTIESHMIILSGLGVVAAATGIAAFLMKPQQPIV